ncbi:hypothetical protein LOD99_4412 [Oopsacas minuta]|uniref:Tetraspanin n=1 Tax=Oopsacas minuta TaxID=111878 RepID=A0AAV7JUZ4_9METZ|nr:hypothetical protein LOD99_4412 [Oopsacas minuta]
MGKKALISKICLVSILIIVNILAVLLSLFLIIAGITLFILNNVTPLRLESLVSLFAFFLSLGVLFLIISIFGLISSISSIPSRHAFRVFSTVTITIYMIVLLLLILLQIGVVIAGILLRDQLTTDTAFESIFAEFTMFYEDNEALMVIVDGFQTGFQCCGFNNYTSWYADGTNFTFPNLPESCCIMNASQSSEHTCEAGKAYTVGCSQSLIEIDSLYLGVAIGIFVFITVFQIVILLINLVLICCIRLDKRAVAYRFRTQSIFAQESYAH